MENIYKEVQEDTGSSQYPRRHNYMRSETVIDELFTISIQCLT